MKKMMIACAVVAMMASEARAELGEVGTKVVQGDLDVAIGKVSEKSPSGETSTGTVARLGVAGAYFVSQGVSVGGRVALGYASEEDVSSTGFGIGAIVGYAKRLGDRVYVWPQIGLSYARATIEIGTVDGTFSGVAAQVYVPVYVEPAEHLLIGIGPVVETDLVATFSDAGGSQDAAKSTGVAAVASLAGWW